ncbi:MAG: Antidote-toxin recognition MazE, bacterial antitoxin [Candidatus Argoarchaeum ethanivorans]|uniref:Antidote-toxin recognition MazE, bacterial antitoxin n=1 Tax=Candidatus Argoarchaeum ethanivorans TaxID=2608793 RepID=A0A811TH93_9EURY|nr:MAG: Antidote-toxin recognition MazE, bacterial antitoxin [Candidatus Argoarchaeum ethanivorans]
MISKNVLAKGQVVIPKTIRDLLAINVGDELVIDVEDEKIILSKKQNVLDVFLEICEKSSGKISMKEIKRESETRYEGD